MDLPEKQMMRELEKALHEIERLRQENARLRKKLGMEVSEPKADYNQSGLSSSGPGSRVEETQETRSYRGHGLSTSVLAKSIPIFPLKKRSSYFGRCSGVERISMPYSSLMNGPERKDTRQLARIHGVRGKESQKNISL
jgi:hypothetical protein